MFPICANWYDTDRRMIEDIGNRSRPTTADCGGFEQRGGVFVLEFENVINELLREICDHLESVGRTQGDDLDHITLWRSRSPDICVDSAR